MITTENLFIKVKNYLANNLNIHISQKEPIVVNDLSEYYSRKFEIYEEARFITNRNLENTNNSMYIVARNFNTNRINVIPCMAYPGCGGRMRNAFIIDATICIIKENNRKPVAHVVFTYVFANKFNQTPIIDTESADIIDATPVIDDYDFDVIDFQFYENKLDINRRLKITDENILPIKNEMTSTLKSISELNKKEQTKFYIKSTIIITITTIIAIAIILCDITFITNQPIGKIIACTTISILPMLGATIINKIKTKYKDNTYYNYIKKSNYQSLTNLYNEFCLTTL